MRQDALLPESHSGFPLGGEMLVLAGYLQMLITVWLLLAGIDSSALPHMHLNAVLTPLVFLLALVWAALRLLRRVTPETATGFGLAAFGLAARALAELAVWVGPPPGRAVWPDGVSPALVDLVRYLGLIAYVTGIAFVVATSAQAIARPAAGRRRVPSGWGARIAAAACLAAVVLLACLWTPEVMRLRAR